MTDDVVSSSPAALAGALRALSGRLKRKLREHGRLGDFTPSQISVLSRLRRDGAATVSDLARAESMRPQSMSALIAALAEARLVDRSADPGDGRRALIDLTPACRARMADIRAAREDWLMQGVRSELSAEERKTLAAALVLINRIIGP